MKKIRLLLACTFFSISSLGLLFPMYVQGQGNADAYLEESVQSIWNKLEPTVLELGYGGALTRIETIMNYLTPVIITFGIVMAFIGAYKMMTSNKEDALKEGSRLVLYGVIGIIVISSAEFLANALVNDVINETIDNTRSLNGLKIADLLYENIMLPFLKLVSYLAMGVLFFIMVGRVISFLTSSDEGVRKKAGGMIARTVIGILIIMAAKQIVEAIFGKRDNVFPSTPETLGEIGSGIYEVSNIPIIYQVINWVMGLATLVVLVLIIFQTFQLLTKPDSPDTISKLKKTLMYVVIGVLVIGAGYIISNVLLINPGTGQ